MTARSYYGSGSALRRAWGSLRHEGPRIFALKLASELGYRRVVLLARPLDQPIADVAPTLPVDAALLAESDIDEYAALRPDEDRSRVRAHLAAGWKCFTLRHEGRIVSACWAALPPYRSSYLGCEMPVAADEVYLTDAWTDPRHRGHSLAHVLCLHQLAHFRDRGFRRAVRGTLPENRSALRAHAKSGFRPVAMLTRVKLGPWTWHTRRDWQ